MDAFDFFFPEQAEAAHLRQIAKGLHSQGRMQARQSRQASRAVGDLQGRLDDLTNEVQFLNALVLVLVKALAEKDLCSVGDLADLFEQVDRLDGSQDQGLDQNVLRGILGIVRQAEAEAPAAEAPVVRRPRLRRHLRRR